MKYTLEVKRVKDSPEEGEWMIWTTGSLDDCLSDFFYYRGQPDFEGIRLVWRQSND